MKGRSDVLSAIREYEAKYRRDDLPRLAVSKLYDLFPDRGSTYEVGERWPYDKFGSSDGPGVYVILDDALNVLYVGKASLTNPLGKRLGAHFGLAEDGKQCRITSLNWSAPPRYVITVGVPHAFEAPALEEFLIGQLQPPDNQRGIRAITPTTPPVVPVSPE